MKHLSIAALIAVLTLGTIAPAAHANQGIYGTWWNLDKSNDDGLGFGFRSKVVIAPMVAFDTRVSWIKFKDSDVNILPIEATGLLRLGMLYAGVGVGYYFFDNADVENNFGWYALGGIEIGAGPVGIFGEVKWTSLSADFKDVKPDAGDLPTSLDADGIGFNLGVMFGVPKP